MKLSAIDLDEENPLAFVEGLPASLMVSFDPEEWDGIEWARHTGYDASFQRPREIEGATFLPLGNDCWILGMKGAQYLHSDRHMAVVAPDQEGHCWNAVIDADGDQMLLVQETEQAYRHHRLEVGALIYFNTYQPHMVSRVNPQDRCVIVQVGGIPRDRPEEALKAMRLAVARRSIHREARLAA